MKQLSLIFFSLILLAFFPGMNGCKAPVEAPIVSMDAPVGLEKPVIPDNSPPSGGPEDGGNQGGGTQGGGTQSGGTQGGGSSTGGGSEPPCPQAVIDEYQSRRQRITNLRQELVTLPADSPDRAGILSNITADTEDLDAFVRSQISRFPACRTLRTL